MFVMTAPASHSSPVRRPRGITLRTETGLLTASSPSETAKAFPLTPTAVIL